MKSLSLILGAAISIFAAPISYAAAEPADASSSEGKWLSLSKWSAFDQRDRQIILMAALEGLVIASTDTTTEAPPINLDCLVQSSPAVIEDALLQAAPHYPDQSLLDVYLALSNCLSAMQDSAP